MYSLKVVGGSTTDKARLKMATELNGWLGPKATDLSAGEEVMIMSRTLLKLVYEYLIQKGYRVQVSEVLTRRVMPDELETW